MTQDELVKKAYDLGIVRWDVAKELVELITKTEREACAKVCDDMDKAHWGCEVKASWCSDAIRARGDV